MAGHFRSQPLSEDFMWLSFNSHYVLHPSRENMGRPRPQTNDVALQKKRQVSTSISGNYFIPTMLVDKDFCTSTCFCSPYLPLPERNIFRWPTQLIPSCFSHYLNKTCHKLSCQKISQIKSCKPASTQRSDINLQKHNPSVPQPVVYNKKRN